MNASKVIFEDMNREMKMELPLLFDRWFFCSFYSSQMVWISMSITLIHFYLFCSRIGCYVTVFQAICNLRDIFYKELTKVNQTI